MKKLLSLLLALTMILPLVGCAAFAENADPIMNYRHRDQRRAR